MKRFTLALAVLAMSIGIVTAAAGDQDTTIRAGGSTTLLPIMANCSSEFMEKYQTWDSVDASLPTTWRKPNASPIAAIFMLDGETIEQGATQEIFMTPRLDPTRDFISGKIG